MGDLDYLNPRGPERAVAGRLCGNSAEIGNRKAANMNLHFEHIPRQVARKSVGFIFSLLLYLSLKIAALGPSDGAVRT